MRRHFARRNSNDGSDDNAGTVPASTPLRHASSKKKDREALETVDMRTSTQAEHDEMQKVQPAVSAPGAGAMSSTIADQRSYLPPASEERRSAKELPGTIGYDNNGDNSDNDSDEEGVEDDDDDSDDVGDDDDAPLTFSRIQRAAPMQQRSSRRDDTMILAQMSHIDSREVKEQTIDDTDGLDPGAEYEAWKQRELARLRREHEELVEAEEAVEQKLAARRKRLKRDS